MSFVYRLLFAVLYLAGTLYFALVMLGGGHGTLIFVVPLVTILAFVAAILLLDRRSSPWKRVLVVSLVAFHYIFTAIAIYLVESGDGFVHSFTILKYSPLAFVLPVGWYATGNILFWVLFWRTRPERTSLR